MNNRRLLTYVGVKPGDVLDVVERTSRPVSITMATNNPGGGISIAAGNFNCSTNAATSGSPVSVNLLPECITGPVFPVIGNLRFNLQSYFSFKKDVTPAASGTTNVSGMSSWAVGTGYTLNVTNAPSLGGVQATLGQIANNQSFDTSPETASRSSAARARRSSSSQAATPTRTRQTSSGVVTVSFTQPIAASGTEEIEWTFVVPPDALTVTAPALPASLAAFTPSAASTTHPPTVAFFESDLVPSYDFVRAHAAAFGLTRVPIGIFSGAVIPALPAAGTLRITALGNGGG